MTRTLVAPVLPPYRDPGGLLFAAMMGATGEVVDTVVTTDPARFRHVDRSLVDGVGGVLDGVPRIACQLSAPPETWASLTEFVTHAESILPADVTEIWCCSSSRHSLAAGAALRRALPGARTVVLVPTWPTSLPVLRDAAGSGEPSMAWPEVLTHADLVISPSPAVTRELRARWPEAGIDAPAGAPPEIRTLVPALGALGATDAVPPRVSPGLRILHVDDGTGAWALRQLCAAVELLPAEVASTVAIEVIGERPVDAGRWLPAGSTASISSTVVTDLAGRRAHRLASDVVYVAEGTEPGQGPSVSWTWVEGWDDRPVLAAGPRAGVLRDLLGHAPVPAEHATALAYAVATAATPSA